MKNELVSASTALEAMSSVLVRDCAPHELYNAVASGRIKRQRVGESRRYVYNRADCQREAAAIKEREVKALVAAEKTPERPSVPLLTSSEALERMNASGLTVTRARFFKLGIEPTWKEIHAGHPKYYYSVEVVDDKIDAMLAQRDGLMSTRQAVAWINKHYGDTLERALTLDAFYHWIDRGQVIPTDVRERGTWHENRFSEASLINSEALKRVMRRATPAQPVPVVNSTDELRALEKEHGPLVTAESAAQIASREGAKITRNAIKGRAQRGTLRPVARLGNSLLFPERDVKPGRARSFA